ncbi:MAG: hypothetical protein R3F17_12105 [Planctomycetota bacterium]
MEDIQKLWLIVTVWTGCVEAVLKYGAPEGAFDPIWNVPAGIGTIPAIGVPGGLNVTLKPLEKFEPPACAGESRYQS